MFLKDQVTIEAMFKRCVVILSVFVLGMLMASAEITAQRLSYSSGENVSPGYEGWEEDPDGSRWFVFGYMNRNWDEEPVVAIGADNNIQPGGPDLGQPTRFLPRRNRFIFRVPIPDDFEEADEMVWTLTVNGVTERAYASLRPDYFMDAMIRASEHGAIGAGFTDEKIRNNEPPGMTIEGEDQRTVRVGEVLSLAVVATDDGVPESPTARLRRLFEAQAAEQAANLESDEADEQAEEARRAFRRSDRRWLPHSRVTVNAETGLRVSWFVYRGDGEVMMDPAQVKVWEDTRTGGYSPWAPALTVPDPPEGNRWVTEVTFDQPGTYVLRCRTSDGAADVDGNVTVTVTQ